MAGDPGSQSTEGPQEGAQRSGVASTESLDATATPSSRPYSLTAARWSWSPIRIYLHCALGSLVATQCDLRSLGREFASHLIVALLICGCVELIRQRQISWRKVGWAGLVIGIAVSLRVSHWFALYVLATATLLLIEGLGITQRQRRQVVGMFAWSLGHGVFPFLAGYAATDHQPGRSALLLCIAFVGFFSGMYAFLRPRPWTVDEEVPRIHSHTAAGFLLIGMAALCSWLWIYGAGPTGIALIALPGFWSLWLGIGWMHHHPHQWPDLRQCRHGVMAFVLLDVAIALACYA